jgi:hypothetical protein
VAYRAIAALIRMFPPAHRRRRSASQFIRGEAESRGSGSARPAYRPGMTP